MVDNEIGWKIRTKYCQIVSETNRYERLFFAGFAIAVRERFDATIFIDECIIQARKNASMRWYRFVPGEIRLGFAGRFAHDFSFGVFAGISRQGATNIVIYEGKCNREGFRRMLMQSVVPFSRIAYPERRWKLQMDNARYHTSPPAQAFFDEHQISHFWTPADLKVYIKEVVKANTQEELIDWILEFWESTVTIEYCYKKKDHLARVLQTCVELNGQATGL